MRRREFIAWCSSAATWPLAARAQQSSVPVIGLLTSFSQEDGAFRLTPFLKGLGETGYVEGRNVAIEYRWAEDYERLKTLADDLVRRRVDVLVTMSEMNVALAAKKATASIPIVFFIGTDPVEAGLVASLNRPGGNMTGVAVHAVEVGPKLLQLLHAMVPSAPVIACILNPSSTKELDGLQTAARALALELHVLHASTVQDFDGVFAKLATLPIGGVVIGSSSLFFSNAVQLAKLAAQHGLPAIHQRREFVQAGGLISYGASSDESFRTVGIYTGRVLNGEKPAELPIQLPTRFELRVNLRTAKALGVAVPLDLLATADEVIE